MEAKSRTAELRWVALVALAIVAVLPAIQMWHWVSSNWVSLPYWDEWFTPGSQFESWKRGTLTLKELFCQHNESRLFFPRLFYFALAEFGGWDVRYAIRALFIITCGFCLLLLHLLRRTPGATPLSSLIAWALMTWICFAPVQVKNFLYGIEIEPLIPAFALLAASAINLSGLSFRAKTLLDIALAFVATYSFANGMLVWALAWPLPAPNETKSVKRRLLWLGSYAVAAIISIGAYFAGYHRPSYHPKFASVTARFWDLAHYVILWAGNYFASDLAGPFVLGVCALVAFAAGFGFAIWTSWKQRKWRTFYPWLLLGIFACATVAITALGRLGFGVQQALDNRYVAMSRFLYVAIAGLYFSIFVARSQLSAATLRVFFLTNAGWAIAIFVLLWANSYRVFAGTAAEYRSERSRLLLSLRWMHVIPDNPDLALIIPYPEALKRRASYLESVGLLRLRSIEGPLAAHVQQTPPPADTAHGRIELAQLTPD